MLTLQCSRIFNKAPLTTEDVSIPWLIDRVENNYRKLTSFQGRAQVSIETNQLQVMATAIVSGRMPDKLKLDLKAGLGMSIGAVTVDGKMVKMYAPRENTLYSGTIRAFQRTTLFPVHMAALDLLHMAAGIPVIRRMPNDSLAIQDGHYLLISYLPAGRVHYSIHPKSYVITDVEFFNNSGTLIAKQEFRQFDRQKGIRLPRLIRVQNIRQTERITFYYESRAVNRNIKDSAFSLHIPESTRYVQIQ